MSSLNKAQIIGRLGQDPDCRYTQGGTAVTNCSVATSEQWKDKQTGEKKERTEWHRVTAFGRTAEIIGEYLKKGSQAYFEGRLQTDKWQDKEGNDRFTTKIIVDRMVMLDTRSKQEHRAEDENQDAQPSSSGATDDFDEDIPFAFLLPLVGAGYVASQLVTTPGIA